MSKINPVPVFHVEAQQEKEVKKTPLWLSARLGVACLGFFGCVCLFTQNASISIATVCMVNHTAINSELPITNATPDAHYGRCPIRNDSSAEGKADGSFLWSKDTQALVLGGFFWGYCIPQILVGIDTIVLKSVQQRLAKCRWKNFHRLLWTDFRILAQKYSAKYVMLIGMSCSTIGTLFTPLAANSGFGVLIAVRIFMGLTASVVAPSLNALWSRWAPQQERSVLVGSTFAGTQLGSILAFSVSGELCAAFGWQYIFYAFGGFSALWCICWFLLLHDSPAQHPRISAAERNYIEHSLKAHTAPIKISTIPWSSMLCSVPVWAAVVAHWCGGFGMFLMLTELPSFMSEVLRFDIKSNGFFSACPYLALLIVINIASVSADYLRRHYLSTTHVRKLMMTIALCSQAAFMIATGYLECDQTMTAVLLLTLSSGLSGCKSAGVIVNFGEIAPRYAGILSGAANSIATTTGFIAPMVSSFLTEDQTIDEWRRVFWVTGGVLLFGCVVFVLFASGEAQSWAIEKEEADDDDDVKPVKF